MASIKLKKEEIAALDYILSEAESGQEGILPSIATNVSDLEMKHYALFEVARAAVDRVMRRHAGGPVAEPAFKQLTEADFDLLTDKIIEELRKKPSLERLRALRKDIEIL